jgi:hypothetical protein
MNWCSAMMCVHYTFQKYIHGSKRVLNTHERPWGPKRFIGDQVQVFPMSSAKHPRHFWPIDRKISRPTRFGRWIQTSWLGPLALVTTSSYELRLGHSLYGWKENFIALPMEQVSCQNHIWGDRNRQNKWTSRIYQHAASPSFEPTTHVSCRSPWGGTI